MFFDDEILCNRKVLNLFDFQNLHFSEFIESILLLTTIVYKQSSKLDKKSKNLITFLNESN